MSVKRLAICGLLMSFTAIVHMATAQTPTLTIDVPNSTARVVLSLTAALQVQATFDNMPADKEHKEKEAIIVWTLPFGDRMFTAESKSGELKTMSLTTLALPSSNMAFGTKDLTATINKIQFSGTGTNTLQAVVTENTGTDYRGYVAICADSNAQDMVIGEDTSGLPGCVYEIAGYCSEPHKGAPMGLFGVPWTSNDRQHWAYWVRQAMIYGSEHRDLYSDTDIQNAIWHIVEHGTGSKNGIIRAIQYRDDGPQRPDERNPSQPVTEFALGYDAPNYRLKWTNPIDTDIVEVLLLGTTTGKTPSRLEDLADYEVLGSFPAGEPWTEQSGLVAARSIPTASGESSVFSQDYALCVLDEDGTYSDLVWAPKLQSPLQVSSWKLNLVSKNPSKSSMATNGEIISAPGTLNPSQDGFYLKATGGSGNPMWSYFDSGKFKKKSRGRYIYRENGDRADLLVNIGGSSRTRFKTMTHDPAYTSLQNVSQIRISAQSGDFSAPVDIQALPKGSGKNVGEKGSVFTVGRQPYTSTEMFVNSFCLKNVTNTWLKDELRFVCRIVGTTFPWGSGSRRLSLYYLDKVLTIEDNMWESQSNGRLLVYKQESSDGRLLVKFDTATGILSFYGSGMNFEQRAIADAVFKVGIASESFIKQNEITCSVSGNSTKRIFSY